MPFNLSTPKSLHFRQQSAITNSPTHHLFTIPRHPNTIEIDKRTPETYYLVQFEEPLGPDTNSPGRKLNSVSPLGIG